MTCPKTRIHPAIIAQAAATALTVEKAAELGAKIAEGKSSAPTRPHPHTPPTSGALKTAGPVAAATDKVRDTITGRGTD